MEAADCNSTSTLPPSAQLCLYLALCCAVFLCISGVAGNILSICVFTQPHFRTISINVLLLALSVADLAMLILAFPVTFCSLLMGLEPQWRAVQTVYGVAVLSLFPVACMAQCASIWLLVTVTIERWAAVCKPLHVNRLFTRHRVVIIISVVCVVSVAYNLVRFWDFQLQDGFELNVTSLRANQYYVLWKLTVADLTVMYLIPLLILLGFNCRVVEKIHKSQGLRVITVAQRGERRTARMLVYVVIMFVACYTPALILNLIEVLKPSLYDTLFGYLASDINNILVAVNAATTWLFYLKFSTRYRNTALYLVSRVFCKNVITNPRMTARYSITAMSSMSMVKIEHSEQLLSRPRSSTIQSVCGKQFLNRRCSSYMDFPLENRAIVRICDTARRTESSSAL